MKNIMFSEICPFLRKIKLYEIKENNDFFPVKNYDNLIIYAFKNSTSLYIDNTRYCLKKGDALIIRPAVEYRFCSDAESSKLILIDFDFTSGHSNVNHRELYDKSVDFNERKITEDISLCDIAALERFAVVRQLQLMENSILDMLREFKRRDVYFGMKINSMLLTLLADIARRVKLSDEKSGDDMQNVENVLSFIDGHFDEDLTNDVIGKRFAMHPNYINALVKSITGYTLHSYLLTKRLAQAMQLLDNTQEPIYNISEKCGFNDSKNFIRFFKSAVGITPGQYRKR